MADWIADLAIVAGLALIATLLFKVALAVLSRFWILGPRSAVAAWMTSYAGWLTVSHPAHATTMN